MKYIEKIRLWQLFSGIIWFCSIYLIFEVGKRFTRPTSSFRNQETILHLPKIGVVMMLHDDEDILPYWIKYHGTIFGMKNMLILDNNNSEKIRRVLFDWNQKHGLQVSWNQGPYSKKGNITYQAFQEFFPNIDIAIPLDSDEFLVAFEGSTPLPHKTQIIRELSYFWRTNIACWGIQQYYTSQHYSLNDSVRTIHRYHPAIYTVESSKKIIRWENLKGLDHGSHKPMLSYGECHSALNHLGLLHFHFREPGRTVQRALNDMIGFSYLPTNVTIHNLENYRPDLQSLSNRSVEGRHKVRQLLTYLDEGLDGILSHSPEESAYQFLSLDQILLEIEK